VKRTPIFLSTVITFAAMAGLSGCSWFHHKSDVYSTAVESRPLEVPPDLDSPPNANELLVPPPGSATASGVAAANAAPAAPAAPTLAANQLIVADNASDTWTKVGPAIESAKIGVLSSRDENQRSFILDFNAPIPKPSAESHWYTAVFNHLGFGEGDPVKAHLLVRVVDDGAASKVIVAGNGNDKAAAAASLRVIQILHDKLPGSSFPPASAPPPAVAGAAPAGAVAASAPPSAAPPPPPPAPSNELQVADSVKGTWIKVGPALERSKLGTISARDDNAYTYAFDFDSSLPKPESEKHWYNHWGWWGGTVKTRLAISVLDDGAGASRIARRRQSCRQVAAAASASVIESLHDKIAGATVATTAPATTYAAAPPPLRQRQPMRRRACRQHGAGFGARMASAGSRVQYATAHCRREHRQHRSARGRHRPEHLDARRTRARARPTRRTERPRRKCAHVYLGFQRHARNERRG
jgi:hypothetical protein